MRVIRVVALAAVLALYASAAEVRLELHLKRAASEDAIEKEFMDRATPGSAKYRQHMSVQELSQLVKPVAGAENAVRKFLKGTKGAKEHGAFATSDVITTVVESGTPVAEGLALPQTIFEPRATSLGVDVPKRLQPYVEHIVAAPSGVPMKRTHPRSYPHADGEYSEPGMEQTPPTIYERYQIPTTLLPSTSVQGVGEFYPMGFAPAALNKLSTQYGLPTPPVRISGPNAGGMNGFTPFEEGPLDIEYITALAPNATTWWIAGNENATWATMADHIMSVSPMPSVVSISWGSSESQYATGPIVGIPTPLVTANDAFRKLGLLGVTVLVSAGDDGVATWTEGDCSRYGPNYPASSPYVTSVGATYATATDAPEQAVYFSGGGFSDFFTTPSWQQTAVENYLSQSGLPPASYFNTTGRGYPDVSALGTNFRIAIDEFGLTSFTTVSGTSASAPAFAGVVSRVNAALVAAGKSTVGFMNPMLYQASTIGTDVTLGESSNGCAYDDGFPATVGWDAVSGLGTPTCPALLAALTPK